MPKPASALVATVLLAVAFALGYAVAGSRRPEASAPAPSRAIVGAAIPPGISADLHAALIEPNPLARAARVAGLLDPLGPDALDEVQAAYASVLLDAGDIELALLGEWWARFDPRAALTWARGSRIGWHPGVITAITREWAHQDPEAASREVRASIQDERLLDAAIVGLVRGWDESRRPGLEDYLTSLASVGGGGRAIEAYTRGKVAAGAPQVAMDWADSLPEGDPQTNFRKLGAAGRVAEVIVDSDPQRAAAWAEEARAEGVALLLLVRVGAQWAKSDGAAAMAWLRGLMPNRDIPTAVQETYRSWYLAKPEAASDWLRSAPSEPWLDPAVATYSLHTAREHPDEALEWAKRIQDERRRDQTLVKLGQIWLTQRPDDGKELIAQAGFSEELQQRIDEAIKARERRIVSPGTAGKAPPPEPQPPADPSE